MESPIPPDDNDVSPPSQTFKVRPFTPDGGSSHSGAVITLALSVVAAALCGYLASLLGQETYVVVIFPGMIGLGVGAAVWYGLRQGKVRDPSIGALAGLIGGIVAMVTMHYFDYEHFLDVLDKEKPGSGRVFQERTGFVGFMNMQAKAGVTLVSTRAANKDRGINLGYGGTILYWLAEVGIVLGIVVVMGRQGASNPFCVACEQWKKEILLRTLHVSPQRAKSAIMRGDVLALFERALLSEGAGETCKLKAYVCPRCADQGDVEIALVHECKNEKGETQRTELIKTTYPGTVIRALNEAGQEAE
jgi:hypothetical protein